LVFITTAVRLNREQIQLVARAAFGGSVGLTRESLLDGHLLEKDDRQMCSNLQSYLRGKAGKAAQIGTRHSNRHHPETLGNPRQSWLAVIHPFI
jgi:hypothetical protein